MEKEKNNGSDDISIRDIFLDIKDWYQFLISKFKLILFLGILGAALGVGYSYTKKPVYVATLTFALEDEKSSGLGGAFGLANQFGLDVGGSGGGVFAGSNLIELFKSRSMVEKTLLTPVTLEGKTISLAEMYIQEEKWREAWVEKPKFKKIQFLPDSNRRHFTREQDSILEVIYKNLSGSGLSVIQKDKKVGILSVEVKSTNEVFSKVFTESLASVVSDFYITTKSEKARLNMTILQRQLDSIRGELNNSLQGVAVANDKTFGLNPALNIKRVPSARRQVDVQTNSATLGELVKQTELAKVAVRKETPLIQIIDEPIYPLKKEKFGRLKGLIYGGFLAGFFTVIFLIARRFFANFK
ncbi:Wzz/FepE/Etk N-terminal domain-containing protein [Flavobacterium sp. DG1-102-2]|uniref:Wzz/FepE/Etk N-terminal domain-containing protein n=1 Tax=Flavobacterium sp. DG1-102-2 TaxID=3081663 RepID=UPI002949A153|nr:Wzz/FepE/Etk N-terminal domain-containing protein [Flavobacterium sp. DG1-102-2]MDV6168373.1 Wzz/FepE/Etk N-terminal domain-containing protein [Flavobacterium sp. DG1-102-2]